MNFLRSAVLYVPLFFTLIGLTQLKIAVSHAQTSPMLTIPEIQGAGHISPFNGSFVGTSGIVTATTSSGFYLQDPTGDANDATSDGIFVYTDSSPSVSPGDSISLTGNVLEYRPSNRDRYLTITEITSPTISVLSSGNPLPTATQIGPGGRSQPKSIIEDDNFTNFNPTTDGIDYYESLEGMLVAMPTATAVSTTNRFGEFWAIPGQGASRTATGINQLGGITISPGDFNPERIQIDDNLISGASPFVQRGEPISDVVGILDYGFGTYELNVTQPVAHSTMGNLRDTSSIQGTDKRLTVASYNVLNLDPFDGASKFDSLSSDIVDALNSPDIIGLQEIQDSDGPGIDNRLDADLTYGALIASIVNAGGPTYEFAEVPPPFANIDGGEPTGNIRVGYLYNPNRVELVSGSLIRHGDGESEFNNSRKPLEITFNFNGEEITLINNHFASKGGSSGLYENIQPFINGNESAREAQAAFVADIVEQILQADPNANIVVLGDLNDFEFSTPLAELTGGVDPNLFNLYDLLAPEERYSYIFEGNSQALDHILVTDGLLADAEFDPVHINSGLYGASDHDPLLASFLFPVPEPASIAQLLTLLLVSQVVRKRNRTKQKN